MSFFDIFNSFLLDYTSYMVYNVYTKWVRRLSKFRLTLSFFKRSQAMSKKQLNPNVHTYSGKELTGYLVGLAGQNIIYNITSAALMYYFQSVIFLPAMAYSTIVAIARVWDAVNDPMMGNLVDKTHTKWGKCKPYLLFVPAVVLVTTILPFLNRQYDPSASTLQKVLIVGWAGFSYILWGMSYTAGDIPLWGVTSLMTEDANDRSKILALARIVASVGVIGMLVQFLAPSLKGVIGSALHIEDDATQLQYSFIILAVILTVFASVLFQFAGLSVKERVKQQSKKTYTIKENFATMWNCKPFRRILISGVLRSPIQLLNTVALTLLIYFYFDNDPGRALMGENGLNFSLIIKVVIIAFGIFGGMLVSSAATPALIAKVEKKTLYNIYAFVGALPFGLIVVIYMIFKEALIESMVASIIMGVVFFAASWAMGGLNVLQSVMIADCVDYEEYHNGVRPDGVFFSGQSFITKLSAGIATIIQGIVYSVVHFSDQVIKGVNDALAAGNASFAVDYQTFAFAMFFLVSVPPMIGLILSALPTLKYEITNSKHKEILSELVEKRRSAE